MLMLGFHIVAVGLVIAGTWYVAYNAGLREGEKRMRRAIAASDPSA